MPTAPKAPIAPTAKEVSASIYLWAQENQLLMGAVATTSIQALAGRSGFDTGGYDDHIDLIRKRKITMVSYNETQKTVYIHTNSSIGKKIKTALPSGNGNIKIEYIVSKPFSIGGSPTNSAFGAPPYYMHKDKYTCGSSISVANIRDAGTLGCLVKKNDAIYGLSNNHVIGGCSNLKEGTPIIGPGVADIAWNSIEPISLGRYESVLPMIPGDPKYINFADNYDAALFQITNPDLLSSMQGTYYDTPITANIPTDNAQVRKVGRTTGHTIGNLNSTVIGPVMVPYNHVCYNSPDDAIPFHAHVYFDDLYFVRSTSPLHPFSSGGDSGSLVVEVGSGGALSAIGLIFAGNDYGSLIVPIKPILNKMGATILSGHNA